MWTGADSLPGFGETGVNDDETAADLFEEVLEGTGRSLLVYDDGNVGEAGKSLYNERALADAVAARMRHCEGLKIYCFFNCPTRDLLFVQALQGEFPKRFMAKARRWGSRPADQRFKIGDRGRVGCLFEHELDNYGRASSKFDLRRSPFALRWLVFGHQQCLFWLRWVFVGRALR